MSSKTKKTILPITGMTCASCVAIIEKALQGLDGVISANVNLASEKATVEYLTGEAGIADFKRAVEGAGSKGWEDSPVSRYSAGRRDIYAR